MAQAVAVELVAVGRVVETGLELVLVLGVVVALLELLARRLLHVVGEHQRRQLAAQLAWLREPGAATPFASVSDSTGGGPGRGRAR